MRLLRKGMNVVSCIFSISDIAYLGYNPDAIFAQTSVMTEELQGLTSFAMRLVSDYFVPIPIPMGLQLEVQALWHSKDIELCIMVPLPFEIFDLPTDCDMEIDITECNADTEDCEEIFLLEEGYEDGYEDECDVADIVNDDDEEEDSSECVVAFAFSTLDDISSYVRICGSLQRPISSDVYKNDMYWFICKFSSAKFVNTYLYLASEWNGKYENNELRIAYVKEHGKHIIKDKAFDILLNL